MSICVAHKDLNVDHSAKLRIIIGGGDLFLNPLKRIFRDVAQVAQAHYESREKHYPT